MNFIKNKSTRALILIMCALVALGFLIASQYYSKENSKVDPRIVPARKLYEKYNLFAQQNALDSVLFLMDTIESVYNQYEHYQQSYEVGVLYNNRAACYLTMAFSQTDSILKDTNINMAHKAVSQSISIYENWLDKYDMNEPESVRTEIQKDFYALLETDSEKQKEIYLMNRIEEIQEAQQEINRRLSVSYTNLGLVYRHKELYDSAASNYIKALEFWEDNLTAENNLNILFGKPLRKRNIIQKLFPPKRD